VLALKAGKTVHDIGPTTQPAEVHHLLDFAGMAKYLAAFELIRNSKQHTAKCPNLIMVLGSRAVDVAKALDESIQVKYPEESDLLYEDGLIEDCHGENKSAMNEAKRLLRAIPMDNGPLFRFMQVYQGHVLGWKFFCDGRSRNGYWIGRCKVRGPHLRTFRRSCALYSLAN
jgi:hypothetical protein